MTFVLAIGQLTPYGGGLRHVTLYGYIYILIHSSIDVIAN